MVEVVKPQLLQQLLLWHHLAAVRHATPGFATHGEEGALRAGSCKRPLPSPCWAKIRAGKAGRVPLCLPGNKV